MSDKELRNCIKREIANLFNGWGLDVIASITERIIDEVVEDVIETSNYPKCNDSDVRIAIIRVVLFNLG
jgi:hypothetical protein